MKLRIAAMAALALIVSIGAADARRCDGFHGCRCGVTQARYFGLPLDYHGINLKRAADWKRLPHTSLQVGVVMYRHGLGPSGHVARVVAVHGGCSITVADETGTHADSACGRGNVFVDPTGMGGFHTQISASTHKEITGHYRHHKKSYRRLHGQMAYYQATYDHDRFGAASVH